MARSRGFGTSADCSLGNQNPKSVNRLSTGLWIQPAESSPAETRSAASALAFRRGSTTKAVIAPASAPTAPTVIAIDIASMNACGPTATKSGPRARVSAMDLRACSGTESGSADEYAASQHTPQYGDRQRGPGLLNGVVHRGADPRCSGGTGLHQQRVRRRSGQSTADAHHHQADDQQPVARRVGDLGQDPEAQRR